MANANKKRIKSTILCAGDLKHKVEIQTRDLGASDFDDDQPEYTFTKIRDQYCAIETVGFPNMGVSTFANVNIEDGATHVFWCRWDATLQDLENRNNYILFNNKRYKVLRVVNINERNTTLGIRTTERGDDSEEAAQA